MLSLVTVNKQLNSFYKKKIQNELKKAKNLALLNVACSMLKAKAEMFIRRTWIRCSAPLDGRP